MNLRVNYEETIATGRNVNQKGEEFGTLLRKINDANSRLKSYWEGSDATKYSTSVEQQAEYMKQLEETINEIGQFLQKTGKAYKDVSDSNSKAIKG